MSFFADRGAMGFALFEDYVSRSEGDFVALLFELEMYSMRHRGFLAFRFILLYRLQWYIIYVFG